MSKKLLFSWALALVAALTCAFDASAYGEYDFTYNNLKFVITSSTTCKVVGCVPVTPSGTWNIPARATTNDNKTYDVTAIEGGAFQNCDEITSMSIANSVDSIGQYAFRNCRRLANLTLPSTMKEIGMYAFNACEALTAITLPEGLKTIKSCLLYGCTGLKSVSLPSTLETIESSAFRNCTGLLSVTIPNSVTNLAGNIFKGCSSMTTLVIGENCIFHDSTGWPVYIFAGCTSLSSITCLSATPTQCHETTFEQTVYDNATLTVPYGSKSTYQSTDCWNMFAHIEEMVPEFDLDEVLNVPGGNIRFSSIGDYPWTVIAEDGREYAQSGNAGVPSSSSVLTATVTVDNVSTLSFDFKAWGEGTSTFWDKCLFTIDGEEQFSYGALQNDWETYKVNLPAGTHTLTWSYTKDGSINPTGDYFAIDNVAISTDLDPVLNVPGGNIHFTSTGDYPWIPMSVGVREYARSGNTGVPSSSSVLTATVDVAVKSTLSFDFKAWGEGTNSFWDKCLFAIDGVEQFSYGAYQNDWETYTVDLPVGTHTLMWSYTKDGSVNPTGDYFAIDNVAITEKPEASRGDVDMSGNVNIADVTALIDYLLSGDASTINLDAADCDNSGSVNISDVTTLIDYLLSGSWPGETNITVGGVSFKMIAIEGGTFKMGASDGDTQASNSEKPAHQVTLSGYSICETEVTQALWVAVMGSNPSYFTSANGYEDDLSRPVEEVSWEDCQTFITKLNQMTGKTFRLPTEAEWEYAARGGKYSHDYVYSGGDDLNEVAWYRNNGDVQTHAVAQKLPNELGLYDMSGNVYEWCQDWYDSYSSEAQTNPTGPTSGTKRVMRGGNVGDTSSCRVSFRTSNTPSSKANGLGLRLAM